MPLWLALASGPLMRFTLAVLVLGLARLIFLTVWDMITAIKRANDKNIPYRSILGNTLAWIFPIKRIGRTKPLYSLASFGFHLGILFSALFLSNHIDILNKVVGIRWIVITKPIINIFTVFVIISGLYLLLYRIYAPIARVLSKSMDYLLLVLLLGIFTSGFIAGRPWNPIPYDQLMLAHTLMGGAILLTIPFTKIAHCVLFPLIRLSTEIAWHFPPNAGQRVSKTLHSSEVREI